MLPPFDCALREARAPTDGERLTETTGVLRRAWEWTGAGFATKVIVDLGSGRS